MHILVGRVEASKGSTGSFAGHRILLTYRRVVVLAGQPQQADPPSQDQASADLPEAVSAPVAADGAFRLGLPDISEVREPLDVAVLTPTGVTVEHKPLTIRQLSSDLTLTATPAQPFVVRPSGDPTLGQARRLTGRVISTDGRPASTGLPLVIYGLSGAAGAAAAPLLSLQTQVGGYFSGPWPADPLVAAYGEIGGARVAISLVDGRLPQRAVLVADLPPVTDDCSCAPAPPRAPDAADLVADSGAYSQDLGGGCVNLTMPNRVIEEYSYVTVVRTTEPDVRPMNTEPPRRVPLGVLRRLADLVADAGVANRATRAIAPAGPLPAAPADGLGAVAGEPIGGADGGMMPAAADQQLIFSLDARRAKELLAEPATLTRQGVLAAAVKSEAIDLHRLIDLLGGQPSRSELDGRHSIDWDATPTVYEATTVALGHVLHFRQVWRADGYSLGDLLYSLPLAPGQKRLVSMVDWTRRSTGERVEVLEAEEQMRALAERDRDIAEIVGSSLDEQIDAGSSTSTSAGGGGIGAGFLGTGFGVLAGVAGGASSSESSSWQDSSRTLAGNSLQQLRDRTSQRASAVRSVRSTTISTVSQGESVRAETEVVANHNHCHAITVEYFEVLRHFQVSEELAYVTECVFVPLPMLPFDQAKARRWRATLLEWLRRPELGTGFDAIERIATNWDGWDYPEHRFSEEAPEELDGELRISFVIPRPHDDADGAFRIDQWNWLTPFLWGAPFTVFNSMADFVNNQFRDINRKLTAEFYTQIQRARDEYFAREIAPRIAEQIVHRMRFSYATQAGVQVPLPMDATLVSRYAEGAPLYVSIRASGALPPLPREEISRFRIYLDETLFAGLPFTIEVVPPEARVLVQSGKARYRTAHLTHLLFDDPRVDNDLSNGDDVLIATPTSFEERKDPRAEDRRAADRLVKHLNEHLEFYHQAIWSSLDPQRRYLLLDGVIAPNSGGRSVASVVENRLIGIVGNCMVLPVTPGIFLDPTLAPDPETGLRVDLIHAYAAEPPPPTRISVPTRGVYAEAVMGQCDACEKKDDTRFWRWEESPLPDEPAPIEPISTDSRQAPEGDAKPTPLPQPIVNIQNAPALPDPLGLSQAMQILGRPDIFRDPSGLAGTQRNALAAFNGVMDTAKAFGGIAAKLASQQEMGRNVDRTLEQVKAAAASGMLTQQQAQDLAHAALRSLAGDTGAEHDNPVHDPEVSKAIEKAAESPSGSVTVTSPGGTVSATFDDGAGSGTVVGMGGVPVSEPLEQLVTMSLVRDKHTTNAPPWKYDQSDVISNLAGVRDFSVLVRPDLGKALDFWDLLVKEKLVEPDPGTGTFKVRVRMRVTYPSVPTQSKQIFGTGKLPVAVLVHGNHNVWGSTALGGMTGTTKTISTPFGPKTFDVYEVLGNNLRPSFEGYAYLQDELAKRGIVSISLDCNLANAMDLLVETRADLILEALKLLADEAAKPGSKYAGRLDFNRIALMGHSRGGDAVVRAAKKISALTPPRPYTVKAVCSLAPTDFTGGDVPASRTFLDATDTDFYLVVYGALDGDVDGTDGPAGPGGTGFRHYDRARVDKAMVFLAKCHHNSFNTVWRADGLETSDPRTLDADVTKAPENHTKLAVDYIGDLFRWRLNSEAPLAKRFDGRIANSVGADASLQWVFGTSVKRVDDVEQGATNLLGGATALPLPAASPHIGSVRDENQVTHGGKPGTPLGILMPHQTHMVQLEWGSPRSTGIKAYTTDVPDADGDWSAFDTLIFSIGGYYDPTSQATIDAEWLPRVRLVLTDDTGATSAVDFNGYGASVPSRPIFTKKDGVHNSTMMRLETVPVALSLFTGFDRQKRKVRQIALELEPAGIVTAFVDSISVLKR